MQSCFLRSVILQTRWLVAIVLMQEALLSSACGSQLEDLAIRSGIRVLSRGDSSADAQKRVQNALPLKYMTAANRQRTLAVVDKCSQFRRLPELQYSADPTIFKYLVRHPDVAVSSWRVMGISKFEMWQTGPSDFEAQAIDGSEGLASVLYQDDQNCIFICDGRYHNPLLPRSLEASALVWFRYAFAPSTDGSWMVTQKADVFISFPSQGLSTVAKMIAPVTNAMLDRNLYEISLYASLMSRAVRDEPEWVVQVARQLDGVLPQRTNELIAVARHPRASSLAAGRPASTDRLMVDRDVLLKSGALMLNPLSLDELAAVPGMPAPSGPPISEPVSDTRTAASSSSTAIRAQSASSSQDLSGIATGTSSPTPEVLPQSIERRPVEKITADPFVLQPVVTPPVKATVAP